MTLVSFFLPFFSLSLPFPSVPQFLSFLVSEPSLVPSCPLPSSLLFFLSFFFPFSLLALTGPYPSPTDSGARSSSSQSLLSSETTLVTNLCSHQTPRAINAGTVWRVWKCGRVVTSLEKKQKQKQNTLIQSGLHWDGGRNKQEKSF